MLAEELKSTYVPGEEDFIDENGDPIKSNNPASRLMSRRSKQSGPMDKAPDLKMGQNNKEAARSKQLQKQK